MKRKLLLTFVTIVAGITLANAQCTNMTYISHGYHPDSIRHATATVPYADTLTGIIPNDTLVSGITCKIDTVAFTSITGLPVGFTATANSTHWDSAHAGCIYIAGTATNAEAGHPDTVYKLTINLKVYGITLYGHIGGYVFTDTNYKLKVYRYAGITNLNYSKFEVSQNIPNPFSSTTTIMFTTQTDENFDFTVYNVIGETVYSKAINAVSGENKIVFSSANLPSGIYMYKLSNKTQTITKRMIVGDK